MEAIYGVVYNSCAAVRTEICIEQEASNVWLSWRHCGCCTLWQPCVVLRVLPSVHVHCSTADAYTRSWLTTPLARVTRTSLDVFATTSSMIVHVNCFLHKSIYCLCSGSSTYLGNAGFQNIVDNSVLFIRVMIIMPFIDERC